MADDLVDLEPMVRDAVLLALPLAPLCAPECLGPAPEAFPAVPLDDVEEPEPEAAVDPRWAALDDLHFDSAGRGRVASLRSCPGSAWQPTSRCAPVAGLEVPPRARKNDGCPQEEDLQVQEPQPPGVGLDPRRRPSRSVCPRCGSAKRPHIVCGNCGWYHGRQAIDVD